MARQKSKDFGVLQQFVESLYPTEEASAEWEIPRLEILLQAESFGLNAELLEIVNLLPPMQYTREKLCSQLNSSLSSHGWGYVYGAVH